MDPSESASAGPTVRGAPPPVFDPAGYRSLLESAPDAMLVVDAAGHIILVNAQAVSLFQYTRDEFIGMRVEQLIPANVRARHVDHRKSFFAESRMRPMGAGLELHGLRKDGTEFPVEISLSPIETTTGMVVSAAIRDVSERRRVEEQLRQSVREKEVLLNEIHHRVKNNLQVIASLLNLQTGTLRDAEASAALHESRNRVKSMALVHETLYQSKEFSRVDFGEYVRKLSAELVRAWAARGGKVAVEVEGDAPPVNADLAINLGLIVNELVSNALKHAFPQGREGKIAVKFAHEPESGYRLEVADDGVGLPSEVDIHATQTLGMQVVVTLVSQIGGMVAVHREGGTRFVVTIPESEVTT